MNVREASILMGADALNLSAELFDKRIADFSIDSRSVSAGELFFALSQEDYARARFQRNICGRSRFYPVCVRPRAIAESLGKKRVRAMRN